MNCERALACRRENVGGGRTQQRQYSFVAVAARFPPFGHIAILQSLLLTSFQYDSWRRGRTSAHVFKRFPSLVTFLAPSTASHTVRVYLGGGWYVLPCYHKKYRATQHLETYNLLISNWKLNFCKRSLYCDWTFVLMSTEYRTQGAVSPCTNSIISKE